MQELPYVIRQEQELQTSLKYLSNKAIVAIANYKGEQILKIFKKEVERTLECHPMYPCGILEILRNVIKKHSKKLTDHLHIIIEIILNCLNPNIPSMRKNCQKKSTYALYTVVKVFPMVSFHQNSQRFAIGTKDNLIIIYDLRTAAKWRILEGHEGPISCLSFDKAGKYIASYSSIDLTVRIWKVGSTGFFGSILGMSGKHYKKYDVKTAQRVKYQEDANDSTVEWTQNNKSIILKRAHEKALRF